MNWKGKPLTDYEIIINLIEGTTTKKGLKIKAKMDKKMYEIGKKISEKRLKILIFQFIKLIHNGIIQLVKTGNLFYSSP